MKDRSNRDVEIFVREDMSVLNRGLGRIGFGRICYRQSENAVGPATLQT